MAYIENGKYAAVGVQASVYRKENGNIVLSTEWAIPALGGKTIRAWTVLYLGVSGMFAEKNMANVKKWATGWDGSTFSWFAVGVPNLEAELVIENEDTGETYPDGNPKTKTNVKWINPVGGNGVEMTADDSANLDRIFGAKLRAAAGVRPVATSSVAKPAAPAKATAPVPPAAPATATVPPEEPHTMPVDAPAGDGVVIAPSTQAEAWKAFCECPLGAGKPKEERNANFLKLVADLGKLTDYENWSPEDWGRLKYECENYLPF